MRLDEISQRASSWEDLPFRAATGEGPSLEDVVPERAPNGDFIFYHGTSLTTAEKIVKDKMIMRDDLGYSGIGTTRGAVSVYGIMKASKENLRRRLKMVPGMMHDDPKAEKSAVLRVRISRDWFKAHPDSVSRETGGSGKNQFLIRPPRGEKGVPLEHAEIVRAAGEELRETVKSQDVGVFVTSAFENAGIKNVKIVGSLMRKGKGNDIDVKVDAPGRFEAVESRAFSVAHKLSKMIGEYSRGKHDRVDVFLKMQPEWVNDRATAKLIIRRYLDDHDENFPNYGGSDGIYHEPEVVDINKVKYLIISVGGGWMIQRGYWLHEPEDTVKG